MKKIILTILITVHSIHIFASINLTPPLQDVEINSNLTLNQELSLYATEVDYDDEVEMEENLLPAIIVVRILVSVGMNVLKKRLVKNLAEKNAKKIAENFAKNLMEKRGNSCFRVKGLSGSRLLLALDRSTVLWAGDSHDTYEQKIQKLCY